VVRERTAEKRSERPTICAACGRRFVQPDRGAPKMYCSVKCNTKVQNRRLSRKLLPAKRGYEKTCPQCGKDFVAIRQDRTYCYSGWCAQAAYQARRANGEAKRQVPHEVTCDGCRKVFTAKHPRARWCSTACAGRHANHVKSRRRQPRITTEPYTDRQIYERDQWRCHICGKKIDPAIKSPDPKSASIDHLVPLALGGDDTPANVAAAHRTCNRLKATKAIGEQLRLT
jgi:hypothetical protein